LEVLKKTHQPRFSSAYYGALNHLAIIEAKKIHDEISAPESGRVGFEICFPIFDRSRASEVLTEKIFYSVLVIRALKDKVTPIGIGRKVAKKTSHISDYKEFSNFGHWLMRGDEFRTVSKFCLSWVQKSLKKISL